MSTAAVPLQADDDPEGDWAGRYAIGLLRQLGCRDGIPAGADHPALAWRRAGLSTVTGHLGRPGLVCPAALASAADGALLALKALADDAGRLPVNGAALLGERARRLGLQRAGPVSPNGSCRLLEAADGRIALNLARDDDWDLLPILLDREQVAGWRDVETATREMARAELMARGAELGLAIAEDRAPNPAASIFPCLPERGGRPDRAPRVVDFSALWAGPLAGSLLLALGAQVTKVESVTRPDGARRGDRAFYDLLNGGKRSVAFDFASEGDRRRLQDLVAGADVVIEASRPRALDRLGLDRQGFVARGGVWVSITAHPSPDRVGFGDDAAVEGGVAHLMAQGWGEPMFAGDAIADPLTGLHAALAAWAAWRAGSGALIRLTLSDVVSHAITCGVAGGDRLRRWQQMAEDDAHDLYPLREPSAAAAVLGAHTAVLA